MHNTVIVPGTFDPITRGHLDVIERAAKLFDKVVVAVAASKSKHERGTLFSLDERIDLVKESLKTLAIVNEMQSSSPHHEEKIVVYPMTGLLVDFAHTHNASAIIKGLRAYMDFEYEFSQAEINTMMDPELESVFIMAQAHTSCISSSAVRELAYLHADLSSFVTPIVAQRLEKKISQRA